MFCRRKSAFENQQSLAEVHLEIQESFTLKLQVNSFIVHCRSVLPVKGMYVLYGKKRIFFLVLRGGEGESWALNRNNFLFYILCEVRGCG